MLTNEQENNPNLSYNPVTIEELGDMVKNLRLPELLEKVGVHTDKVILTEIGLYRQYDTFINEKNLPLIKDYLRYKLVAINSNYLTQELNDLTFDFYNKYLMGQQEQRSMDKRAMELINGILGEAFGKLYVEKYFPEKAKEEMLTLIDYLKKSFAKHIKEVTWMSDATKEKAMEKLNKFSVKVGYPDKWKDYSQLTISAQVSLFENITQVGQWAFQRAIAKVGKEVDKTEWVLPPQTVNAYYDPTNNEIVFPAGILQPPFFSFEADPAVNFGAIGGVIGHEMTHGFDDQGRHYDKTGNMVDWWTADDAKNFDERVGKYADFFSNIKILPDLNANGRFTLGENLADHGGLEVAFHAFEKLNKEKPLPVIDNLTPEQRFFIAYAGVWAGNITDEEIRNRTKSDPHSLGKLRVNAALPHINAWYKAFNVTKDNALFIPENTRLKLW